jgi:hypothetical protein
MISSMYFTVELLICRFVCRWGAATQG